MTLQRARLSVPFALAVVPLLLAALVAPADAAIKPPATSSAPASLVADTQAATWQQVPWDAAFTAQPYRQNHAPAIDFAGHPLDTTFDATGAVWTVGEFGMQFTRGLNGTMTRVGLPLKTYTNASGQLSGWTQPFSSTWGGHTSSSELGEAIISTPGAVWAAYGGQQSAGAPSSNHSILVRISTTAPYAACSVPLPGGNNEVMGLAYDSKRARVYFASSEGDHPVAAGTPKHSTIGWVKAAGLGSRCQNGLDYGGNPALTEPQNAALRASAQVVLNSLECTVAQEAATKKGSSPDCVHVATNALGSGAAHLTYDVANDALWSTNWYTRDLAKISAITGAVTVYPAPPAESMFPVAWQVAATSDAVYVNEYEGNRLLRFDKTSSTWSTVDVPTDLITSVGGVQTHSLTIANGKLWFTISDEDYNPGATAIGVIDLSTWVAGAPTGTLYTGWDTLPMQATAPVTARHSFRGLDVMNGKVAVTDHGDMQTVVLSPK